MKIKSNLSVSLWAIIILAIASSFSYTIVLQNVKEWVVPESAKKMKNPVKKSDESVKSGKTLYLKHCKSCHGTGGKGDGTKSKELETSCGDFTLSDFQKQTDGSMFYKVKEGRKDMPSFKKKITDEEDIWAMVIYMRTFDKSAGKEKPKVVVEEKKENDNQTKKTKDTDVKKEEKKVITEKKDKAPIIEDSISLFQNSKIELVLKHFETALNASDSLVIATLFDTNAIFIPSRVTTASGAIQIKNHFKQLFKTHKLQISLSIEAIELSNDFAFVRLGSKGHRIFLMDNHDVVEENSIFMVMKKMQGDWKIYYCIVN